MLNFDRLPTKKPRLSQGTPEVHVAVNFVAPIPGAVSVETERKSTPRSYTSLPVNKTPSSSSSPDFNLPVCLLLELMDIDDPSPTFKYVEFEDDLRENGVEGILDVYRIPQMLLVTFGNLEFYGADHLHTYIEERLMPLIKPGKEEGWHKGGSVVAGTRDVEKNGAICKQEPDACLDVEVEDDRHFTSLWKGKGWLLKEESVEAITVWPSDEEEEVEAVLPPIAVLDDAGTTSDSSESFECTEA